VLLPCLLHVLLPRYLRFLGGGLHLSHLSHFRGPAQFTDLAGYTSISERLGRVVPLLAEYLEVVSAAVLGRGGTIDKFIGDGVMAFWGAPVPNERHALDACAAALEKGETRR
jgi:class 3 adenylate cyclase